MKKITFSDKYGLTQSVLSGRKTMTRRICKELDQPGITYISDWGMDDRGRAMFTIEFADGRKQDVYPHYQPGEKVAVAQRYWSLKDNPRFYDALAKADPTFPLECIEGEAGCKNKMFVKAEWMPNRILITDVGIEQLLDISDEDCLREGVWQVEDDVYTVGNFALATGRGSQRTSLFETPRAAFLTLIKRLMGKDIPRLNPWVFVYEFKLTWN